MTSAEHKPHSSSLQGAWDLAQQRAVRVLELEAQMRRLEEQLEASDIAHARGYREGVRNEKARIRSLIENAEDEDKSPLTDEILHSVSNPARES